MGREIRRVPRDWLHPRTGGAYVPMHDQTYEDALAEWKREKAEWMSDANANERERIAREHDCHTFEEWHGDAPDPKYYRPAFTEPPTHYQIYENVSEGTPTSPVFAMLDDMYSWLISQGYSKKAARRFTETGHAPSMVFVEGGGSGIGIHSLDFLESD